MNMYSYIVNGGKKLNGSIDISGSKNASLPILSASILNKSIVKLYNVPEIEDVNVIPTDIDNIIVNLYKEYDLWKDIYHILRVNY